MIIYDTLNLSISGSDPIAVTNELTTKLMAFKEDLQSKPAQLSSSMRKITNELPITGWLREHLAKELDGYGFLVDTQSKLLKLKAPVNEYVSSHPDLL